MSVINIFVCHNDWEDIGYYFLYCHAGLLFLFCENKLLLRQKGWIVKEEDESAVIKMVRDEDRYWDIEID